MSEKRKGCQRREVNKKSIEGRRYRRRKGSVRNKKETSKEGRKPLEREGDEGGKEVSRQGRRR